MTNSNERTKHHSWSGRRSALALGLMVVLLAGCYPPDECVLSSDCDQNREPLGPCLEWNCNEDFECVERSTNDGGTCTEPMDDCQQGTLTCNTGRCEGTIRTYDAVSVAEACGLHASCLAADYDCDPATGSFACADIAPLSDGSACERDECGGACVSGLCDVPGLGTGDLGPDCDEGEGTCNRDGQMACIAGVVACNAVPGPAAEYESCDGLDNDCDGETDEPEDLRPEDCAVQHGVCEDAQTTTCLGAAGWAACTTADYLSHDGRYEAAEEATCDGLDNDCNDDVDDLPLVGQECNGERDRGACRPGFWSCDAEAGALVCVGDIPPEEERCDDHVDNDCDGLVDQGCPCPVEGALRPCYTGDRDDVRGRPSLCLDGIQVCRLDVDGELVWDDECFGAVRPMAVEYCEGELDEDCNGRVDDGCTPCPCGSALGIDSVREPCGTCGWRYRVCLNDCWFGDWGPCFDPGPVECTDFATCTTEDRCAPCPGPPLETCDGVDNDCDGHTDEGHVLDCPSGQVCRFGQCCEETCFWSGARRCVADDVHAIEACDDYDGDGCREWAVVDHCPEAERLLCGPDGTCVEEDCPGPDPCDARECGWWSDGCDQMHDCGTCGSNETCGLDGACVCAYETCDGACCDQGAVCPPWGGDCCEPEACEGRCGDWEDRCGVVHACGGCALHETCDALSNRCVCETLTCAPGGVETCCPATDETQTCHAETGRCCIPECGAAECGDLDGCGGSCGACDDDAVCHVGRCCVPRTDCADVDVCGLVSDGCGGDLVCPCEGEAVCALAYYDAGDSWPAVCQSVSAEGTVGVNGFADDPGADLMALAGAGIRRVSVTVLLGRGDDDDACEAFLSSAEYQRLEEAVFAAAMAGLSVYIVFDFAPGGGADYRVGDEASGFGRCGLSMATLAGRALHAITNAVRRVAYHGYLPTGTGPVVERVFLLPDLALGTAGPDGDSETSPQRALLLALWNNFHRQIRADGLIPGLGIRVASDDDATLAGATDDLRAWAELATAEGLSPLSRLDLSLRLPATGDGDALLATLRVALDHALAGHPELPRMFYVLDLPPFADRARREAIHAALAAWLDSPGGKLSGVSLRWLPTDIDSPAPPLSELTLEPFGLVP